MNNKKLDAKKDIKKIKKSTKDKGRKKIFQLIETLPGTFFSNRQGLCFYGEESGIPVEIDSSAFEGLLANKKYEAGMGLPSGEEISNIRRVARYWASKNITNVGVRAAKAMDTIVYDPVRADGQLYFMSVSSCELKQPDKPYTVRYPGMLEAEVRNGTFHDHIALIELWNLSESGRILSMGLDFSRFIPDIPHAMEIVTGSHGAGKTSYTEIKRELFDPSGVPSQSLKFDERDLSISAMHQGMLAFDNVNTVIPDYISDIICRLTTGQGFRTRELYTNMGEVILKLKKPILMNGINRPGYKPDFIDRECPIDLGVMPESKRLTDAQIRAKATELLPKVRGFLLSIIPKAMQLYPEVEKELEGRLPRMADFVLWAECGIRAMGFPPMAFFHAYAEAKRNEVLEVAKDTVILEGIQSIMANRESWEGTSSDLLDLLHNTLPDSQGKFLPKDERRLGRLLKELLPTLQEIGYVYENLTDGKRTKRITKVKSQENPKVNVKTSVAQAEAEKHGTAKLTLDTDINFLENSNVSTTDTEKDSIHSEKLTTDINFVTFTPEYKKKIKAIIDSLPDGAAREEYVEKLEDIENEEAKRLGEKGIPKTVEIPLAIKEEAIKTLDTKLLLRPESVICEKSNIERYLSEYGFESKHIKNPVTADKYSTFIRELLNQHKIEDNGRKWKSVVLFYKSEKQYEGKFIEAFKHRNYHYYKISMLAVDDGSKNWISWLNTASTISEKEFETMISTGTMLRTMLYYSVFVPLKAYIGEVL